MNVTMDLTKDAVLYVVDQEYPMRTTVKNVQFKKKIEMVVRKLSTWDRQKLTCSMSGKNTDSKKGSHGNALPDLLLPKFSISLPFKK